MKSFVTAVRSIARRPAFAISAWITLALGIAVTTTMFSVVDTVLIKPLPFPHGDRLVSVMETNSGKTQPISLVAPGRLEEWNRANRTFDAISGIYTENVTETSGDQPERLAGRRVAPRYFVVFDAPPIVGRAFTPDEERFGGPRAAIIGEGLWTRRYGRDPQVIGKRLVFAGDGYTIVGVAPSTFGATADVWLPAQTPPGLLTVRAARFLSGVGRMKPGVTVAEAAADLARVQRALGEQYPATDKDWSVHVADLKEFRVGDYHRALFLMFGAVALLLAIVIANIAGLMLVQLHRRGRELAIRQAIGGSRGQIVGALMREVVVLACAGAIGGTAGAFGLIRLFSNTFTTVPRINELTLDWRALVFATAASGAASLVFGLWPALNAMRSDSVPLIAQAGSRVSPVRHRLQQTFVVAQIALGVLLTVSAGLMLRSYGNLTRVDTGFRPEHVMSFHVGAAWTEDRVRIGHMQEQIFAELRRRPDVVEAGMTSFLPATGATLRYQVTLAGMAATEEQGKLSAGVRSIGGGYLLALNVPLLRGSWCPPLRTDFKTPTKAVVNRAFAERTGRDVVGRSFSFDQIAGDHEIVGVVGNVSEDGPSAAATPYLYVCDSAGAWPDPEYIVRTRGDERAIAGAVRDVVRQIDSSRAVFGVKTMEDVLAAALDAPRLNAGVLSLFAAAALGLAALGLYSLLTLIVSERTRELGVRLALGAPPVQLAGLVLGGAGRLLSGGIGAGVLLALASTRVLATMLFGIGALDTVALTAAIVTFALVTLAAAVIPAWRAAAIDPIEAIRAD